MIATHATARAPSGVHETLRPPGQPAGTATRAFVEPRFGQDFSRVRVHSDDVAFGSTNAPAGAPVAHPLADTPSAGGSAATGCVEPCGSFPWVPITPKRLMALCDDRVRLGTPSIVPVPGCTPGRPGRVVFHSGGWAVENACAFCEPWKRQPPLDPSIQIGFVQMIERTLQGGVYYKKVADQWEPVDRIWFEAKGERDCLKTAKKTEPWYGPDAEKNFGPQPFNGPCPIMFDNPHVALPTHHGEGVLRRLRIDGVFHMWLIAKRAKEPPVFIHHWTVDVLAVAVLPDNADPCNFSQWQVLTGGKNMSVTTKGPGQGPATPVLTGPCAKAAREQSAPK